MSTPKGSIWLNTTRPAPVAKDAADNVANSAPVQTEAPGYFDSCEALISNQADDFVVAGLSRCALGIPGVAANKRLVCLGALDLKIGPHSAKESPNVRHVADAPVKLGLPFWPVVGHHRDRANPKPVPNKSNDGFVGAGYRDFHANLGEIDTTLSIKEASEPRQEQWVGVIHTHIISCVPQAMGRAIARAVRLATEVRA
jgi:hypothetical protein